MLAPRALVPTHLETDAQAVRTRVARAVREGLARTPKSLPPWLFYDAAGSALYEDITALPEYYLTRAEAEIFRVHGDTIAWVAGEGSRLSLAEIGAGTAVKTELLLQAVIARQHTCSYLACDISSTALAELSSRLSSRFTSVDLRTAVCTHEDAAPLIATLPDRQALLFIGSSIGNLDDLSAARLLRHLRTALRDDGALIVGADRRKSAAALVAAYDDVAGVTAAFNKNVLVRINRELRADFDVERFRHVAVWNERASNIEMHLESTRAQLVRIGALGLEVPFHAGERIHTETSAKYDDARIDRIFDAAGFARARTFSDASRSFNVHVAYAITGRG
jgi:dimethylhistidine N-methyltransferase